MSKVLGLSHRQIRLLLGSIAFNFMIYNGGRFLAKNLKHQNLSFIIDQRIPFISWTILIYWGCYLFWIINYCSCVKYDKGNGYRFIRAHYIGEAICFICFILFPTSMIRPEVTGNSVFCQIIKITYAYDEANNLFPSIHCFVSWLCWIGVRNNTYVPEWYQKISLFSAFAVCFSTLTVKQHVIADVLAGILLAEISYLLAEMADYRSL